MRKPSRKFHSKLLPGFKFAHFPKLLLFQKKSLKTTKFVKLDFFFISSGNFIGLFNGILFVFILSVVVDTQKETSELYCRKISSGHHCSCVKSCSKTYFLQKTVWRTFQISYQICFENISYTTKQRKTFYMPRALPSKSSHAFPRDYAGG